MAEKHHVHFAETLTGFKWLATVAREHKECKAVFAFEEAIGYTCGDQELVVGDKDGVSACCVMLELANHVYSQGKTIHDFLKQIYEKYGHYAW